jgi:hypothetical protein
MAESFVKTFKHDYIYAHDRPDAQSVLAQLPRWFEGYNVNHPQLPSTGRQLPGVMGATPLV